MKPNQPMQFTAVADLGKIVAEISAAAWHDWLTKVGWREMPTLRRLKKDGLAE
ncbi:hypothetical protein [Janthinobacterium sp.]|uniref:hypothetical protein n=1 Tax=Janthinobacterium sp. TaxID=1871054 RepID=UPI00293D9F1D|nr:hypothetical protein [Janthinobacterium sp.]